MSIKKRKTKGRQHPLRAESLDSIADELAKHDYSTVLCVGTLVAILREEAGRVRGILR